MAGAERALRIHRRSCLLPYPLRLQSYLPVHLHLHCDLASHASTESFPFACCCSSCLSQGACRLCLAPTAMAAAVAWRPTRWCDAAPAVVDIAKSAIEILPMPLLARRPPLPCPHRPFLPCPPLFSPGGLTSFPSLLPCPLSFPPPHFFSHL